MTARDNAAAARTSRRRAEEREFRMMLRFGIVFFLLVFALNRLMPWNWLPAGDGAPRQSILSEARQAAHTTIPFAFMG